MAIPTLPEDFKEFLKLLGLKGVEYLLVGGYAVSIHGYVRATNDLDIWVKISPENALAIVSALRQFGFAASSLSPVSGAKQCHSNGGTAHTSGDPHLRFGRAVRR